MKLLSPLAEHSPNADPEVHRVLTVQGDPHQGTVLTTYTLLRRIGVAGSRSGGGGKTRGREEG